MYLDLNELAYVIMTVRINNHVISLLNYVKVLI